MARARYTWQLRVAEGDEPVDLSGDAEDLAHLRHALGQAATDATVRFDPHHVDAVADEEDGWELRAAAPPPAKPKAG